MTSHHYERIAPQATTGVRWDVPGRHAGQIVEVAYATRGRSAAPADEGDEYRRTTDRSDGTVVYARLLDDTERAVVETLEAGPRQLLDCERELARALGCPVRDVSAAVDRLRRDGVVRVQAGGPVDLVPAGRR